MLHCKNFLFVVALFLGACAAPAVLPLEEGEVGVKFLKRDLEAMQEELAKVNIQMPDHRCRWGKCTIVLKYGIANFVIELWKFIFHKVKITAFCTVALRALGSALLYIASK